MANLKELSKRQELLSPGHRACVGCGAALAIRQVLLAAQKVPVVASCCTGCLEIFTSIYPFSAWRIPWFHNAFENSAATASGMEAAFRAMKRTGKIAKDVRFIAFGGDGGTYDIGLQSLSGAMERGHRMLYVCYNNDAYMNTGIQRSSSTPRGMHTTTSPAGTAIPGKQQNRKDLTEIMVAHNLPYVAQAEVTHWQDLTRKVETALDTDGPTFLNIYAPCQLGWGYPPEETIGLIRIAVETCFWPVYEVVDGKYKVNIKPKEKKPLVEFLKPQARFRHLFAPKNEHILDELQAEIDSRWESLLAKEALSQAGPKT